MSKRKPQGKGAPRATKKPSLGARAIHAQSPDGSFHAVGVADLRVMVFPEDDVWYAQGLEIDYVSQGATEEEAKRAFEDGLMLTVTEHLQLHGELTYLLVQASPRIWQDYFKQANQGRFRYTQVSIHQLPRRRGELQESASAPAKELAAKQALPFKGISYAQCGMA